MVMKVTKICQMMKTKSFLSIEWNIIEWGKTPSYNKINICFKKVILVNNTMMFWSYKFTSKKVENDELKKM